MKIYSRLLIQFLISFFTLCASFQAAAVTLDAKAAKSLISDRMWTQNSQVGPGLRYWSWKSDGSVCLRTESKTSKCADKGRWKLDSGRLCYELEWGGASMGVKSACFRISDQKEGLYEALQDNGFTLFKFSVSK